MIKPLLCLIFIMIHSFANAQYEPRGRYYPNDQDIPLPDLGFAGTSMIIGVVLFLIGVLINKSSKKDEGSNAGCLFTVCGFICCIPSLIWLQAIVSSIIFIGIIIIVVIGILALLWEKISGK